MFRCLRCTFIAAVAAVASVSPANSQVARPAIFIPGILGSILTDQNGTVIWGDRFSLRRFERLELRDDRPKLVASDLIGQVQILGPWKVHVYDDLLKHLHNIGYKDQNTLFLCPYDWRQSNFSSAKAISECVIKAGLKGQPFDIIAHSMGGLIARIYVQQYDTAGDVKTLITLGTPFLGSAKTIYTMQRGWGFFPNWMAGGIEKIKNVIYSFPSFFELLPTYDKCCILGLPAAQDRAPVDLLDVKLWKDAGWLSNNTDVERLKEDFEHVRELRKLVQQDVARGVETFMFAGATIETVGQFYISRQSGQIVQWINLDGDGTVPAWSAANGNIRRSYAALAEHAVIFTDDDVKEELKRILEKDASKITKYAGSSKELRAQTDDGHSIKIQSVDFRIEPDVIEAGTNNGEVVIVLTAESGAPVARTLFTVRLLSQDGKSSEVIMTASQGAVSDSSKAVFRGSIHAPSEEGVHTITLEFAGSVPFEDYFATIVNR
jgi:pimeloyl-ACP methyl ester carboxylesterase